MTNIIRTFSLTSKVCCNSALSLSENGECAISTEDGIQIMDPSQQPTQRGEQFSFTATRIIVCPDPYSLEVTIQRRHILDKQQHHSSERSMKLFYDRALNAKPDRGYTFLFWSPAGMDHVSRCVLVTLTLDHRLSLYSRNNKRLYWTEVVRLSDLLSEYMKGKNYNLGTTEEPRDDIRSYTHQLYSVITTVFAWSPHLYETNSSSPVKRYGRLATTTKNGHVIFWRIDSPVAKSGVNIERVVQLPHEPIVSSICWCTDNSDSGFLALGCVSGLLYTISLQDYSISELWTKNDHMRITNIVWLKKSSMLVASKGPYLLMFNTTNRFGTCNEIGVQCVSNKMPLSGLTVGEDDSLFVSTINGNILQGEVIQGKSGTGPSIDLKPLSIRRSFTVQSACHGLAISKHSIFIATVESPSELYCHLRNRDPLKLNIINLSTPTQVSDLLLGERTALGPMHCLTDILLGLKYHKIQLQSWPEIDHFMQQMSLVNLVQQTSLFQLKLLRYILQLKLLTNQKSQVDEKDDTDAVLGQVNEALTTRHLIYALKQLLNTENTKTFTDIDERSAGMMCRTLRRLNHHSEEITDIVNRAEALISQDGAPETCPICKCCINDPKLSSSVCPNGHKLDRCEQTLLQCDDVPYRVCVWCGVTYVNKSHGDGSRWLSTLLTDYCTHCDQVLVHCQ